jgi:hypothetical protein
VTEPKVWTFFYGSYINFDVLKEVELEPTEWEVACVHGYDIKIEPRANLERSDADTVYGILATATHKQLDNLYAHALDVLGETYLPEAVLAETLDRNWRPALCYICPDMEPRSADPDYVARILGPARQYGFPSWYLDRLARF